jgi:ABC-type uncharacterized transport system fused permease/ATPase subunit
VRENAESIAFFRGEATEGKEISSRFSRVVANAYEIIGTQRNLEFFTTSYNYLTWILPVVVIAPQYIAGNVELGVVQQAAAAFGHVLDDLSLIINEFEGLSEFSASIGRLHQFVRGIQSADPDRDETSPLLGYASGDTGDSTSKKKAPGTTEGLFKSARVLQDNKESSISSPLSLSIASTDDTVIRLNQLATSSSGHNHSPYALCIRNLRLETPDRHRTLIHSLSLELRWNERLLIIGASGIGKSSLLRAIAGLWNCGSGTIERANTSDVYFLPQKPYCPLGSLRDQLMYPMSTANDNTGHEKDVTGTTDVQDPMDFVSDQRLLEILRTVDLGDLASRVGEGDEFAGLDVVMDWSNMLSLGEQQRLGFGRVLVHNPKLIIVDEATSAMDVAAEERMYRLIENLTVVSVGHRPTLLGYHTVRLHLQKSKETDFCQYTIEDIVSTPHVANNEEVNLFFR